MYIKSLYLFRYLKSKHFKINLFFTLKNYYFFPLQCTIDLSFLMKTLGIS